MPSKPLTIMHVASGDLWAGAEVQLFMLARAQIRQGMHLCAILLNPGILADKLAAEGVAVQILSEAEHSTPAIFLGIVHAMRHMAPDIVHTHRFKENLLAGLAAWLNRIPSVRTQHGAPEFNYQWWMLHKRLLHAMDRWVGNYMQRQVIAVTQELATKLHEDFPAKHVTVIENGVDTSTFTQLAQGEDFARPFAQAKRRVGIVGRLVAVKRVDLFIDTAALLMDMPESKDVEFFVIGDGPLRMVLEEKAAPLRGRLHFLGNLTTIHPYIEALDVLLLCSDHEGLPMTLLEAMVLGVPVVGHDVGGIEQLLDHGRTGWPVSDQNPLQYREQILQALNEGKSCAKVSLARENVSKHFDSNLSAQQYIALYKKIVAHQ